MRKIRNLILAAALVSTAFAADIQLQLKTRTVYIVHMNNELDRHLASRLTSNKVVWVVLDPKDADAVITDRVDNEFWTWAKTVFGVAKPAATPFPAREDPRAHETRSTVFLVDPRAGVVLWSMYEPAHGNSSTALDQVALRVAKELKKSGQVN
jgi:hypothetical protein